MGAVPSLESGPVVLQHSAPRIGVVGAVVAVVGLVGGGVGGLWAAFDRLGSKADVATVERIESRLRAVEQTQAVANSKLDGITHSVDEQGRRLELVLDRLPPKRGR